MSEKKQGETKKQRMSEAQKTHLITYMVDHSFFAKHGVDPGPKGAEGAAKRWEKLAKELNAIGAASKDASGWKQTWSDMKLRIKKLAVSLTDTPTGNAGKPPRKLKPEEELVYHLCGGKDFIGAGAEEELGIALGTQQQPQPALDDDDDDDYGWLPPPPPELVREEDEGSEDADMPDEQTDTYSTDTETIEFDFPELGLPLKSITLPTRTAPKNSEKLSCQRMQRNNNPEKEQTKSVIPPEIPPKTPQSTQKPALHSLPSCSKENGTTQVQKEAEKKKSTFVPRKRQRVHDAFMETTGVFSEGMAETRKLTKEDIEAKRKLTESVDRLTVVVERSVEVQERSVEVQERLVEVQERIALALEGCVVVGRQCLEAFLNNQSE